ncbi:hypothetical protein [Entomospira culicis]|uniref:Uncharacterized protein n=1 Tax=Entomospira culicis TaxID=2719989 RepID=A0A968GEW8_9SPIO|nr:hypothetical protein [Entomospira culicis]NIZ19127.1 hypothetical protein [Entomospira culicis]NIZ69341.1 hypothetical protein [Entomospira culicis]WDI37927.1 hypothetical protein PVA46_03825 [Entomospira culicis]WDI39554.1 hypothetical protein PVA47_03825 [Entomospira culicis]
MKKENITIKRVIKYLMLIILVGVLAFGAYLGYSVWMIVKVLDTPYECSYYVLKQESGYPAPCNHYLANKGVLLDRSNSRRRDGTLVRLGLISDANCVRYILDEINHYAWRKSEYDTIYLKSGADYYHFDIETHVLTPITDKFAFDALGLTWYRSYKSGRQGR